MKFKTIFKNSVKNDWFEKLEDKIDTQKINEIFPYLIDRKKKGVNIVPSSKDCFNAFKQTPYEKVRVVIIGQDPYPGTIDHFITGEEIPYATGVAFGIPEDSGKVPASLRNILSEVVREYGFPKDLNQDYTLKKWTEQGVFLINTALTTEEGVRGAHTDLWECFTEEVVKVLGGKEERVIWLLWGNYAQSFEHLINPNHLVLKTSHPSPLSAHRGFTGCGHFRMVNEVLNNKIEW